MEALVASLIPLVTGEVANLVKGEVEALQKQHPGSTPVQAIELAIEDLLTKSKIAPKVAQQLSSLIKAVDASPIVNSIRDFAVHFDTAAITTALGNETSIIADKVRNHFFKTQPIAAIQGIVAAGKVDLVSNDPAVKNGVVNFLSNLKGVDTTTQPMSVLAKLNPEAIATVPPEKQNTVIRELKRLFRVQPIAPTTKAMQTLVNNGQTTSLAVANIPKASFVAANADAMTAPVAAQVHTNAVDTVIRNENALASLSSKVKGTGLAAIDGNTTVAERKVDVQTQLDQYDLNLDNLFGSMDECVSDDCTTVYSAASYFVDLLQFLRNNNLETLKPVPDLTVSGNQSIITGTILEKLFRRRPDLGDLELTCENTNTILPYIDSANEIMESFIVNMTDWTSTNPHQATIDTFNVTTQDTTELLSQPQNTNYDAYRTMASSVYPFTLPYHQPIQAQRQFLNLLKVMRTDLLDACRHKPPTPKAYGSLSADQLASSPMQLLQQHALDRQVSAETLGLVQEEYIILTKEAFFPLEWFNTTENLTLNQSQYQNRVGVKSTNEYWGYGPTDDLSSATNQAGLQFVKKQFLPRSGIQYADLIQIVETLFINPSFPKGQNKTIFDELKFSYRFLQTLVDQRYSEPQKRLGKLATFLVTTDKIIRLSELLYDAKIPTSTRHSKLPGATKKAKAPACVSDQEVRKWVYTEFEGLGKITVLEFGEGPFLQVSGEIFATLADNTKSATRFNSLPSGAIGLLSPDGRITDNSGMVFANVNILGQVIVGSAVSGMSLNDQYPQYSFDLRDSTGASIGSITGGSLMVTSHPDATGNEVTTALVQWEPNDNMGGGCNIDDVTIAHLDGTPLDTTEWDRIHRFIRLWKTLGWPLSQVDLAINGLSSQLSQIDVVSTVTTNDQTNGILVGDDQMITFDDYNDSIGKNEWSPRSVPPVTPPEIDTDLIDQLAAFLNLQPFATIPTEQLLTFWINIPTSGSKSLYSRLFFTNNLQATDAIFSPDVNGDYFTGPPATITDNRFPIMAAFNLKSLDIDYLLGLISQDDVTNLPRPVSSSLNIDGLSMIYRYSLLAKVLQVDISQLGQVFQGFCPDTQTKGKDGQVTVTRIDPFTTPLNCLALLKTWNAMQDAGFSWDELRYVVDEIKQSTFDVDPLAPSRLTVLQTSKTLYDGITSIQINNPILPQVKDGSTEDDTLATDEIVTAKLQLVFASDVASQILALLDGTTLYTVPAPLVPDDKLKEQVSKISPKLAYVPNVDAKNAILQSTGILTQAEIESLKGAIDSAQSILTNESPSLTKAELIEAQAADTQLQDEWATAVNNLISQPQSLFNNSISSVLDINPGVLESDPSRAVLLAADFTPKLSAIKPDSDVNITGSSSAINGVVKTGVSNISNASTLDISGVTPGPGDGKTSAQKRYYFLQHFIPFLRNKLIRTLLLNTITSAVGFDDRTLAQTILEDISFNKGYPDTASDILLTNLTKSAITNNVWNGYIVATSSDNFTFSVSQNPQPSEGALVLNGMTMPFSSDQQYPAQIWSTSSAKLGSGQLYTLTLTGIDPSILYWKSDHMARALVPDASLLPQDPNGTLDSVFERLQKMAILVNHFKLSPAEMIYIHDHNGSFDYMQFNSLDMKQWEHLQSYVAFRDSLPKITTISLIDLFNWSSNHLKTGGDDLATQITGATMWNKLQVQQILDRVNFSYGLSDDFQNEIILVRFKQIIDLSNTVGVDIPRLFTWASPLGTSSKDFFKLHDIAEDIQKVAKSRYDPSSWPDIVRPLNDVLRTGQADALISYLLVQDELINEAGITDADSLFEFFLIDVQMTPVVETSRIKQAISTVQVYIQRCLLGLEEKNGVDIPDDDFRDRWAWMQKYRTWEANRQVFLYPENWMEPSLRDDKSDFFTEFEAELLQKDLSDDVVFSALKNFLYNINDVANMEAVSFCVEYDAPSGGHKLHLFCRTRTAPFLYYYNCYYQQSWSTWQKMDVQIPQYTVEQTGTDAGLDGASGAYLAPIVFNGRLLLFIPQILKKTSASTPDGTTLSSLSNAKTSDLAAKVSWEIKLSWSELRNGRWTPRQLCPDGLLVPQTTGPAPSNGGVTLNPLVSVDSFTFVPSLVQQAASPGISFPSIDTSAQFVRILLSRISDTNPTTIGEWAFTDGQLSFRGTAPTTIAWTKDSASSLPTSFGYHASTRKLHSTQAFDQYRSSVVAPANQLVFGPSLSQAPFLPAVLAPDTTASIQGTIATFGSQLQMLDADGATIISQNLYHAYIHQMMVLAAGAGAGDVMPILDYLRTLKQDPLPPSGPPVVTPTSGTVVIDPSAIPPAPPILTYNMLNEAFGGSRGSFNELGQPFSIYNWELGLHAPMLLIDRLLSSQQFDQALNVCHYVFNPMAAGDSTDMKRFWVFAPFTSVTTQTVEQMFMKLKPGTWEYATSPSSQMPLADSQFSKDISAWRDDPYQPFVVARGRPQAYMMWIVMKYIEILTAYGDFYFRQNTLETIPMAIQMYVMASHIYGPRGQQIQRQTTVKPYTYNQIATKFDAFSNAMVQLEETFPFSNQTTLPLGKMPNDSSTPLANVFGFASTLYFAIPSNPTLLGLGSTIDDRLFKIRHSQDINGIFRILPLFEPPIDPALLVQAAAQGLSLNSVLADMDGPMPNYRFQYLIQKALDLASEVRAFGSALISAREKEDFENLSVLRAKHDNATQNSLMDMKTLALDEANKTLDALQYSRNGPVNRLQYYLQVIGGDISGVPSLDAEFAELSANIEKPVAQGGLQLSPSEVQELQNYTSANNRSQDVAALEFASTVAANMPTFGTSFQPLGAGGTMMWGGGNIAAAYSGQAGNARSDVDNFTYQAMSAGRKAQAQRALQDRILQANVAGYEISTIDKQITASKIRIAMASKDIDSQQKQIDQAKEVEDYLRSKYSNADLYSWMEGATRALFYTTYTQAYDVAKKAEKVFKFERPKYAGTTFIQSGYWDASRDGLLSGENLLSALKSMEAAYQTDRGYDFEISKNVSLRQVDPLALMQFRESGTCSFSIPEILFDMDFPGHYLRRIKSVSVTIPCIVGPYTSINCSVSLSTSRMRINPTRPTGDAYFEIIDPKAGPDSRFAIANLPITAIAVSSGQNDAGVFELNFRDDRYLPFEGAGAISTWQIELPQHGNFRQFAYESITDVIFQIKYTSIDGGEQLKQGAKDAVSSCIKNAQATSATGGLFALFDLKNEFASAWQRMVTMQRQSGATAGATMELTKLNDKLPVFAAGQDPTAIQTTSIWLLSDGAMGGGNVTVTPDTGSQVPLTSDAGDATNLNNIQVLANKTAATPVGTWTLQLSPGTTAIEATKAWLLVKYTLR